MLCWSGVQLFVDQYNNSKLFSFYKSQHFLAMGLHFVFLTSHASTTMFLEVLASPGDHARTCSGELTHAEFGKLPPTIGDPFFFANVYILLHTHEQQSVNFFNHYWRTAWSTRSCKIESRRTCSGLSQVNCAAVVVDSHMLACPSS